MEANRKKAKGTPFIKNHYYPGKLLHASDFVREQEYGSKKLAFANQKFHGSGIVDGLSVRMDPSGDWYVTKGSALDADGRFLLLTQDTKIDFTLLDGLRAEDGNTFVLGIRYAECALDKERSIFEGEETYQTARIAEGVSFGAYPLRAWREMKARAGRGEEDLTVERVLYEDGEIRLLLKMPRLVPADSIFRVRLQAVALCGREVEISWRGEAKLTGAFFAASGGDRRILEKNPTVFSGMVEEEWDICTGEDRNLPVIFELSRLEFLREGAAAVKVAAVQVTVETAASYRLAAEKYLRDHATCPEADCLEAAWLPLACFRMTLPPGEKPHVVLVPDDTVRFYTHRWKEEEMLRQAAQENGIVDIRWRSLLKNLTPLPQPFTPPQPILPQPEPIPLPPSPVPAPSPYLPETFSPLFQEEWEQHIHRGVTVIPVPKHYRKGQVLLSEEISHGFAGKEVMLYCGRLREAGGHIYWERDKKSFLVVQGDEGLFPEQKGGWEIEKQALRQNVAEGSFQIALTLTKGRRRNRITEVAISWTAVKSI